MGARGVNNLAAKLLLTLYPVNTAFFRYTLEGGADSEMQTELQRNEKKIVDEIETTNTRTKLFECFRHSVVAGNALLDLRKSMARVFHLDSFVCQRDPRGKIIDVITREKVTPKSLPIEIQAILEAAPDALEQDKAHISENQFVSVYTWAHLDENSNDKFYNLVVEIAGVEINSSRVIAEELPLIPVRFHVTDGESYGRGLVEEYFGDLRTLEGLNRAIIEGSAGAARMLALVDPTGLTKLRTVERAPNMAVRPGRAVDVTFAQVQKHADLSVALQLIDRLDTRLSFAFLLNTTRDAERVTAEEIRFVAQELEDQLGGVFSQFATELQLPTVMVLQARLIREGRMDDLRQVKEVKPAIVTGIAALERTRELIRLDQFIGGTVERFGPEALQHLNLSEYLSRRAVALRVEKEGLVKPQQQVQQEQQQAQMLQLAQTLGPEGIKQAGPAVMEGLSPVIQNAMAAAGGG